MREKRILRLNLKRKYWEQIKRHQKLYEYRLASEYWRKRLQGQRYDEVHLCLGYPSKGDKERVLRRLWMGCFVKKIQHPEFGRHPVEVYAIDVSVAILDRPVWADGGGDDGK